MITMLDCIKKGVPVGHTVLDKAKENTAPIKTLIPDLNEIEEIFMIASGSSFNARWYAATHSGYCLSLK